jgi:hypothetical protein
MSGSYSKEDLDAEFSKNGFIVVRNVFSEEHCDQFRAQILDKFNKLKALDPNQADFSLSQPQAFSIPGLWEFLVNEKMVQALKTILENEYTMTPNFVIQKNKYCVSPISICKITIPNRYGWHIDAGGDPINPIQLDPDYRFVKCGLYLQDNDPEFGGGIDVVPGSHKLLLNTGINRLDRKARLLKGKLGVLHNNKMVSLKKGDAVIFHSFLMHSSTNPLGIFDNNTEINTKTGYFPSSNSSQKAKLALYFDACRSRFASPFLKGSLQRAKKELDTAASGGLKKKLGYCEQISFLFEKSCPQEFLERVKKNNIQFPQLKGSDLDEARHIYELYKAL